MGSPCTGNRAQLEPDPPQSLHLYALCCMAGGTIVGIMDQIYHTFNWVSAKGLSKVYSLDLKTTREIQISSSHDSFFQLLIKLSDKSLHFSSSWDLSSTSCCWFLL